MRPPRSARSLLAAFLPARVRDAVLEDLDRRYRDQEQPRVWYWTQVFKTIRPSLAYRTEERHHAIPRKKNRSMESFLQDLMYGLRSVRRNPGFAVVVMLTLGIGIGVNTAIFSIVNGVLLQPLPYGNAERLVMVSRDLEASGEHTALMQAADGVDLVAETKAIEAVAIFTETVVGPMNDIDTPLHVKQARVSANLFDVLGVQPHIGRTFIPEDDTPLPRDDDGNVLPNPPPYASIISYGLWQRAYGGDPGVLGKPFRLWGRPHVIVGVLPQDFRLLTPAEANIGTGIDVFNAHRIDYPSFTREAGGDFWRLIAVMREGATIDEARAEATALSARLRERDAYARDVGMQLRLDPLHEGVTGPARGTLVVFMGAVAFVLLIACANVANLLLVRGAGRGNEIAVRAAMGAGRTRIVRQLLTEAAVLAIAGGGLGILLAAGAVASMRTLSPGNLPRVADIGLDANVLGFTLAVALAATLASGLLPALNASSPASKRTLGTRGGGGGQAKRSQRALVVAEVALSMVLLVGAGLMILTFAELQAMSLGFEPERVLTVTATQGNANRTIEESLELERALVANVAALPGVEAAGVVFPVPMNGVLRALGRVRPRRHGGRSCGVEPRLFPHRLADVLR